MSGKYPPVTVSDLLYVLNKLGYEQLKSKGSSHKQFKRNNEGKKVTVADHGKNEAICKKTFSSTLNQMSLDKDEFYNILNS